MKIVLDTNAYTRFLSADSEIVREVASASLVYLPVIVLGELRAGFACGNREAENLKTLSTFLRSPKVQLLAVDEQTTVHYAELYAFLRRQGTPIPMNDLWIAAMTQQHNLVLCTNDKHFDHLPQVTRR